VPHRQAWLGRQCQTRLQLSVPAHVGHARVATNDARVCARRR
jgi:hypothetical protein